MNTNARHAKRSPHIATTQVAPKQTWKKSRSRGKRRASTTKRIALAANATLLTALEPKAAIGSNKTPIDGGASACPIANTATVRKRAKTGCARRALQADTLERK